MSTDPKVLKIEITRRCNARCVFCNHDPACTETMSVETFCAILDDFPDSKEVQPQWFGEPLMHPQFREIVLACKDRGRRVVFYTNGSLIHRHLDAFRLLVAGDKVILSVEGRDAKTYESIRLGLHWDKLLENVGLLRGVLATGVQTVARITCCKEIADDIDEVRKFWEKRMDSVIVVSENPLARSVPGRYRDRKCVRPTQHFTVKADGEVCLCCINYHGGLSLGNVRDGARKVWEEAAALRHCSHKVCNTCLFKFVPEVPHEVVADEQ